MNVIIVRGASGVVVWAPERPVGGVTSWVCQRDKFSVPFEPSSDQVEAMLLALAQHSQQLVGAIAQVVQLDV